MKVTTPQFRVAFPAVFEPKWNKLAKKNEYVITLLFDEKTDMKVLKEAAKAAVIKEFGPDNTKWPIKLRSPFRDQGDRAMKDAVTGLITLPQGYKKGNIYITASSKEKPGLVNRQREHIIDSSEFYGGCYAICTLNAYAYSHAVNKGVAFGLQNIQKVAEGEAFGNRSTPEEDFKPIDTPEQPLAGGTDAPSAADLFM